MAELIANGKAHKGDVTFGSSGIGNWPHLNGELVMRKAGFEMTHIPYRGAGPAIIDLVGGRLTMMFNTTGSLMPHVRGGRLRALAVSSAKRFSAEPNIPTVAESGVPGFDVSSWYGLFAPAKTPPEIVKKMNADAVAVMREPRSARSSKPWGRVIGSTPEAMGAFLKAEMAKWEPVIKAAGIKAE